MPLFVAVQHGDQLVDADDQAGFFLNLPGDGLRWALQNVAPAARQSPVAVGAFPHQQHLAAGIEDSGSHIDLGCHVAGVEGNDRTQLLKPTVADEAHQLFGTRTNLLVSLPVIRVIGEGQPVLRHGKQSQGLPADLISSIYIRRSHESSF